MWGLLVAACVGIFSSMFNISAPASMARYDKDEAPAYRQEYNNSYFESGFQANDESGTQSIIGKSSETALTAPQTNGNSQSYINLPVDVSKPEKAPLNEKEGDSFTVLSGN